MTDGQQLLLPFDEFRIEKEKKEVELPFFENPRSDNERLLQFQYEFRHGDKNALDKMYRLGFEIAMKFINTQAKRNSYIRSLGFDEKVEKANDATTYIIEQYLKRPDFSILKNWPGYLFLRVQHELYYQREVDKAVEFIDLEDMQNCEDTGEELWGNAAATFKIPYRKKEV